MNALIRRRILTSNFANGLAVFNGEPSVFYQKVPDDSAFDGMYPHVVFTIDKFSDAIHGVAGLLTVDIICTQTTTTPELLESKLRPILENVFFSPHNAEIFALKWSKTDAFQEPASERLPLIVGVEIVFEVREFPSAETVSPDPIQALNLWATRFEPRLIVVGSSEVEEIFEPSNDLPAVYFDAQRTRLLGQTHTSATLETTVNAHIFVRGIQNRRRWITALMHGILTTRAIFLADGSPMRLTACEQIFAADELQGQLQLTFEYGLLRPMPYAHPLVTKVTDFDSVLKRNCTNHRL